MTALLWLGIWYTCHECDLIVDGLSKDKSLMETASSYEDFTDWQGYVYNIACWLNQFIYVIYDNWVMIVYVIVFVG